MLKKSVCVVYMVMYNTYVLISACKLFALPDLMCKLVQTVWYPDLILLRAVSVTL